MKKSNCTSGPYFNSAEFGKRLKNARQSLGITQEELAERISVDRNHITRMERGVRVCSIDLLVELATALDVSTDYLLVGESSSDTVKKKLLLAIEQLTRIAQSM